QPPTARACPYIRLFGADCKGRTLCKAPSLGTRKHLSTLACNHKCVTDVTRHPLREPVFRALWSANLVSNIGTWMQSVGGAWLMTTLTAGALPVALMQSATTLPSFLVGLPAGSLADRMDRRRLLLITQTWMLASIVALA